MSEAESDARCIEAVKLTIRFVWVNFIPLAMLLLAICIVFGKGYEPGVDVGLMIVFVYFTVAYKQYGRGNRASLIIAGLAGLAVAGTAAAGSAITRGEWDSESESDAGFTTPGFDTMGNLNDVNLNLGMTPSSDTFISDDLHSSVNPANCLPMLNDVVDIHGNMFGTTFLDDTMNSSTSLFDDDWNK